MGRVDRFERKKGGGGQFQLTLYHIKNAFSCRSLPAIKVQKGVKCKFCNFIFPFFDSWFWNVCVCFRQELINFKSRHFAFCVLLFHFVLMSFSVLSIAVFVMAMCDLSLITLVLLCSFTDWLATGLLITLTRFCSYSFLVCVCVRGRIDGQCRPPFVVIFSFINPIQFYCYFSH